MKQTGIQIQNNDVSLSHISKLINSGHFEAAEKLIKKAEKKGLTKYETFFIKAKLAAEQKKLDNAEQLFLQAKKLAKNDNDKSRTVYQLSRIYTYRNEPEKTKQVIEDYKGSSWKDDRNTHAYLEALKQTEDQARLEKVFPKLSSELDKIRLLLLCSQCFLHTGQINRAKEILYANLEKTDDRVRACLMLITLEIDTGHFKEAIELIEKQPESVQRHEMIFREWARLKHHFDPTEKWIEQLENFRNGKNLPYAEWTQAALEFEHGHFREGSIHFEARYQADLAENRVKFLPRRKVLDNGLREDGYRTLVSGEQGVGDQVRFARYFHGLGPEEKSAIAAAVEDRLTPLFKRSFPDIEFLETKHLTKEKLKAQKIADEIIIGSVGTFPSHEQFPSKIGAPYLKPDPGLVKKIRDRFSEDKLTIGVFWRSIRKNPKRFLWYPPLKEMTQMLKDVDNIQLVCLQNDILEEEMEEFQKAELSLDITDVDCKDDLDGLAALCVSVDAAVGVGTATAELAAAVGAKTFTMANRDPERWYLSQTYMDAFYPDMHMRLSETGASWQPSLDAIKKELARLAEEKKA